MIVDPKSAPLSFRLTAKSRYAPLCLLFPTRPTPLGSCWVPPSLTILPLKRPSTGGLRPPYWMYPLGLFYCYAVCTVGLLRNAAGARA